MNENVSAPTVSFTYVLGGLGWAHGRFAIGGTPVELVASYLTDALGDLVAAAVALIDGTSRVEVVWVEEPGTNLWSFEREGSSVRVTVTHDEHLYPRKDAEPGAVLFDARCEVDALGRAVATGAREVLENVGVDGYLSRWKIHAFPLERLLLLEDALRR